MKRLEIYFDIAGTSQQPVAGYGRMGISGWSAGWTTYGRKTDGTDEPGSQATGEAQFFF